MPDEPPMTRLPIFGAPPIMLHPRSAVLLCWFLAFGPASVRGADGRSVQQFNGWGMAQVQVQVAKRWWVVPELQWRRYSGFSLPLQEAGLFPVEYRTGAWSLQAGYARWYTHPYGAFRTLATQAENRTWLQAGYQHPIGRFRMDHRFRLEQRFLERYALESGEVVPLGYRYVGRARYRVRAMALLHGAAGKAGEWQAFLQQEVMVRYGDPSFRGAFDQMRPAFHLGFRPVDDLQLTAGYQMQYLVRSNGSDAEWNQTFMVGVFWRLPLAERRTQQPTS